MIVSSETTVVTRQTMQDYLYGPRDGGSYLIYQIDSIERGASSDCKTLLLK